LYLCTVKRDKQFKNSNPNILIMFSFLDNTQNPAGQNNDFLPNLGQIVKEIQSEFENTYIGYEMDCLISPEFTPAPDFSHIIPAIAKKYNIEPLKLEVQILARISPVWLVRNGIFEIISEEAHTYSNPPKYL